MLTTREHGPALATAGGSGRTVTVSSSVTARTVTASGVMNAGRTAVGSAGSARSTGNAIVGDVPQLAWDYQTHLRIHSPPALGADMLLVVGTDGTILVMPKQGTESRPWRRVLDARVSAPTAQNGDDVYVAAENGSLYAFRLPSLAEYARLAVTSRDEREPPIVWRYGANAPVRLAPVVSGDDVFLIPEHGGLIRLHRATGERAWQSPTAERFLAANPKFVYATDRLGRLLVLDRARGSVLSALDTSEFVLGARNEENDRVVLAANDGMVIALHDRAYAMPLLATMSSPRAEPETPAKSNGANPGDDKKADDKNPAEGNPKGR